ncbi:DUF6817 domain-containing protein [Anatilimnocola floriformis]|uniref:DUF6817 domain-containing protein n=1 Tax=Anatilimnocola floriformis TaxID=2948575 RepID=UPI0020C50996|nr:hypothetical protein [Anatilimnocola floriformis]
MSVSSATLFYPKQSNTGLYCQLHVAGHSAEDILRVRHAYRIACSLFNGRFRKTERAFICHAVGAASALTHFSPRVDMIIAAMMHAAYDSGQFPDGKIGYSPEHRKWLRNEIGEAAEQLAYDYQQMHFGPGKPEAHATSGVPAEQREILFMALTHEVDDMADAGFALAPKYGRSVESRVAACAQLARQIGEEELAQTIEGHGRQYHDVEWLQALEMNECEGFRIAPNMISYFRLRRDSLRGNGVKVF